MERFAISLIFGLILFQPLVAQERSERRRDGGTRGGQPPWMQGGPGGMRGGQPPWMQGGPGGMRGGQPPWMQGGPGGMRGGQPPWMQGGPGGMRGGNNNGGNERSIGMLRSMDRNGNGRLEPDEIPEYRRPFVTMLVSRMGGNPNGTIDLNSLARQSSSGNTSSRSTNSRTSASTAISTDPLVPYFGEKEQEESAVLAFGQREPQAQTAAASQTAAVPALSPSDQILRTARQVMNQFDKNKNGMLDKDKGEWNNSLPFNADSADKNRDGRISMSELIAAFGGKTSVTTGAAAVAVRQSDVYDRLPLGMPEWFFGRDKDNDGQISMTEYLAEGQTWSEDIADEFRFLDKNNDGTATATEIIEVLKQVDEEKQLKEEQAKREKERRSGQAPPPAAEPEQPASPQPANQQPNTPQQPSPAPVPAEGQPNWRPSGNVPASAPSTAPYASGTSNQNRRDGRDGRSDRERGDERPRRNNGSDRRR